MQVQMRAFVYKAMSDKIRAKIDKLIQSGITDDVKLFEETMKNAKSNEQFKSLMKQMDISIDVVEALVKDQIKEALLAPKKKGLFSKILGR